MIKKFYKIKFNRIFYSEDYIKKALKDFSLKAEIKQEDVYLEVEDENIALEFCNYVFGY